MDLSINLEKLEKKNQNWYSNPYPKIKIFFLYLNYLIRNLQKIWKKPKPKPQPKYSTNWKPKPRFKPLGFIGCICLSQADK